MLKAIRKIRKKHYEETKNMSITERMEYDHLKAKSLDAKLAKIDINDGKYVFQFLYPKKDNTNKN
ncbi:MAG: hypothetical protein LBC20_16570 [Planctomycetaceae bacterium]|jgi:hypothetical protein|nr:hypothetical protein [Planctomycetaceae bacterium]